MYWHDWYTINLAFQDLISVTLTVQGWGGIIVSALYHIL
jgi:hypothetical protein